MKYRRLSIAFIGLFCLLASHCCVSSDVQGLAKKLKAMEKNLPLPYHEALQASVRRCSSAAVPCHFDQYSAFIDTELAQRNMPEELKYLPFALSKMNPNFNDGDRRGYWSLPTVVGLRYGLNIDAEHDERLDLEASTSAALDYLAELNARYHNWWLSILAFANSANALHHAMMLSDEIPELWDFYEKNLLPNTQIISDFISYIYLGNEGELRFTTPIQPVLPEPRTETAAPLVAEQRPSESTTPQQQTTQQTTQQQTPRTQPAPKTKPKQKVTYYTVKKGDNLTKIANKFHVTVSDLMKWNHLKNDRIREGQKLTIKK